jgi:hypothetical protein
VALKRPQRREDGSGVDIGNRLRRGEPDADGEVPLSDADFVPTLLDG